MVPADVRARPSAVTPGRCTPALGHRLGAGEQGHHAQEEGTWFVLNVCIVCLLVKKEQVTKSHDEEVSEAEMADPGVALNLLGQHGGREDPEGSAGGGGGHLWLAGLAKDLAAAPRSRQKGEMTGVTHVTVCWACLGISKRSSHPREPGRQHRHREVKGCRPGHTANQQKDQEEAWARSRPGR